MFLKHSLPPTGGTFQRASKTMHQRMKVQSYRYADQDLTSERSHWKPLFALTEGQGKTPLGQMAAVGEELPARHGDPQPLPPRAQMAV